MADAAPLVSQALVVDGCTIDARTEGPTLSRRRWPNSPKNLDAIALRVPATCRPYRIKASARQLSIGLDATWRSPTPCAAMSTTLRFAPSPVTTAWLDLADPEDWGPNNRILKNYLSFSFSRAVFLTERDVNQTAPSNLPLVFDGDRCLFNTGLYTRRYETIYGLFEPNTRPDARQRWFLKGFFKESDPMLVSFEYLPCRVRFTEDPSELVFDYRLPIRSNIDHILGDEENLTRIPASLMGEGNSLLLRRAFEGAVVEAARRAAANYTLAVPQFYGGRIQLLLPLCLTGDKPELALTIQREDGFYAARTCLTLEMAYNNARLICRPETSWIKR